MTNAVLFDLDDTLLDRTSSLRSFLEAQYLRFSDRLGSASSTKWQDRFLELDQRGHVSKSVVYPQILQAFDGDASAAESLFSDYDARCFEHAREFPRMTDTLKQLRGYGVRLGIVTNGWTGFQTRHIKALGLHRLVDTYLISDAEKLRKPDAEIFARAAERVGAPASSCLFVGDNPVADILGAHGAGMQTAWIRRGFEWPTYAAENPGPELGDLSEVSDLVRRVRSGTL